MSHQLHQGGFVFVFVCSSVSKIKLVDEFWWNFWRGGICTISDKICFTLRKVVDEDCWLSAVTNAPFMRQCWGLPHRLAQCMSPQGWGKLVNAALLSLISEACVNVCCTTLLLSELVGPTYVQARSSNPKAGRVGLVGRDRGRSGYWVALYLYIYTARLLV